MYPCTKAVTTAIRAFQASSSTFITAKLGRSPGRRLCSCTCTENSLLTLFTLKVYFIPPPFVSVQQTVEKSLFLNYFYKHCMHRVMAPLMAQTAAERVSNGKGTGGKACIGIYISHELTTLKWGSHDGHMSSQHSSGGHMMVT